MTLVFDIFVFILGVSLVTATLFSAISTFVLPRSARSRLNRLVFGLTRRAFEVVLKFTRTYEQRDAVMAYYAPIGLIALVPVWYVLIAVGYSLMYWALGVGGLFVDFNLSGSSLLTLGFATSDSPFVNLLSFSEALIGLILVALLMAYLPTMYAAFSRREQAVTMLEVRAGTPPSATQMLMRFNRIHGLDRLGDYWKTWELWFADVEESNTTLPALVFFRSPRSDISWITAAGTVMDTAALTLSAVNIPYEFSAALSIRAGFMAMRRIADYFDIPYPNNPSYPSTPISIARDEFESALNELAAAGLPLHADREKAWQDFAGWRVNYDRVLLVLCSLTMAPHTPWSSDRMPQLEIPPLWLKSK